MCRDPLVSDSSPAHIVVCTVKRSCQKTKSLHPIHAWGESGLLWESNSTSCQVLAYCRFSSVAAVLLPNPEPRPRQRHACAYGKHSSIIIHHPGPGEPSLIIFGELRHYWAQTRILTVFRRPTAVQSHFGRVSAAGGAVDPGCNPNDPAPSDCIPDPPIRSHRFISTLCVLRTPAHRG